MVAYEKKKPKKQEREKNMLDIRNKVCRNEKLICGTFPGYPSLRLLFEAFTVRSRNKGYDLKGDRAITL